MFQNSSQNNRLEEQMHPGQGAPITLVNCFPPPGREGEDPSRLISMLTIKGKSFFFFFFKRLLLCNDCIYVFHRNKIHLCGWITQGPDVPTGKVYQLLISVTASEGA